MLYAFSFTKWFSKFSFRIALLFGAMSLMTKMVLSSF